jgi:hypothetical protein
MPEVIADIREDPPTAAIGQGGTQATRTFLVTGLEGTASQRVITALTYDDDTTRINS